jgi:flagellar M-ring protein FliF
MAEGDNTRRGAGTQMQTVRLTQNPLMQRLAVMIGIAVSVALGVVIALWSFTPNYSLLYGNLSGKDASEVMTALQQAGIEYRVDDSNGAVMVKTGQLREARLKLAGQGLPRGDNLGFELLQQESGFGTSRAVEAARFHRALEGELARTIATLSSVQSARVHLATPKQSVFVRDNGAPSASVVVKLYSGRVLEKGQVTAIVHLVASSVPELEAGNVTVVDQEGNLLSGQMDDRGMMLSATQFEYTKQLEQHYQQQVEEILTPILGADRVRAQVAADVDFTVTEQTAEHYNPDQPALRSEQVNEQESKTTSVQGVPGALSNQPPAAGTAPQQATAAAGQQTGTAAAGQTATQPAENQPLNVSKRATRNYELDKTVSHTQLSTGVLRRLSVAVVVDDRVTTDANGTETRQERTPEEISRITQLVKEAIGFSEQRGDSVQVVNAAFHVPPAPEALPEPAFWEQPWVWDLGKIVGGIVLVALLIFFVLAPTMKRLLAQTPMMAGGYTGGRMLPAGAGAAGGGGAGGIEYLEEEGHEPVKLPGPAKYEDTLDAARQLVQEDPKRVAQVVRSWVSEDG